ncbi:MAG TPA: hypothetical protein VJI15_05710 [Candidatus Nanoarchaeia archaeon]|nr:hypothetical protein [Candidatus Nanoarchaeia archaeon]
MAANPHLKLNILKNGIVLIIAFFLYPAVSTSLRPITAEQTRDILLIISMLLVTVCFANFAFTYGKSKLQSATGKALAHVSTGVFLLLTALLLESIVIIVKTVYPAFYTLMIWFSVLLYSGIVLYDFWDITSI